MKILVINGHPDKGSFCQEIFRTIVENIDSNHHELESINLNEIDFDPVLRYGYRKRMEEDSFILCSVVQSIFRLYQYSRQLWNISIKECCPKSLRY